MLADRDHLSVRAESRPLIGECRMPSCTNQYTGITVCVSCVWLKLGIRASTSHLPFQESGMLRFMVWNRSWPRERGSSSPFVGCCRGMVGCCLMIRLRIEGSNRVTGCCVWTRIAVPTSSHVLRCCAVVVRVSRLEQHHDLDLDLGLEAPRHDHVVLDCCCF